MKSQVNSFHLVFKLTCFNYTNETTELLFFCYKYWSHTIFKKQMKTSSIHELFKTLFMIIYSLFNS